MGNGRTTRREFTGALAGALLAGAMRAEDNSTTISEREYHADAQILVLGVPVLHRAGVGGGSVVWREAANGERHLEFHGYSLPARAAGLNRVGLIRETAHGGEDGRAEFSYFGLMTSS